jgi:hypothetical protein
MQGLIVVLSRNRDVIVKLAGHRPPKLMQVAKRQIAGWDVLY